MLTNAQRAELQARVYALEPATLHRLLEDATRSRLPANEVDPDVERMPAQVAEQLYHMLCGQREQQRHNVAFPTAQPSHTPHAGPHASRASQEPRGIERSPRQQEYITPPPRAAPSSFSSHRPRAPSSSNSHSSHLAPSSQSHSSHTLVPSSQSHHSHPPSSNSHSSHTHVAPSAHSKSPHMQEKTIVDTQPPPYAKMTAAGPPPDPRIYKPQQMVDIDNISQFSDRGYRRGGCCSGSNYSGSHASNGCCGILCAACCGFCCAACASGC